MNKTYIVVVYAYSQYCNWWKKFPVYTKTLQRDQKAEIAHLEQEVHMMRGKHSEAIQKLKSQFLREKRSYQRESDDKIQEMAQQASQVREPQQDCAIATLKGFFFPFCLPAGWSYLMANSMLYWQI